MKMLWGLVIFMIGLGLLFYLGIVIMLYGGIMQAITMWQINNSLVVWGIIRAVFCEIGMIPGWIIMGTGLTLIKLSKSI